MTFKGHAHSADAWDSHAGKWSSSVQTITVAPCTALLDKASSILSLTSEDTRVLDNGAGSGQLTGLIKSKYPDVPIVATDLSKGMLETIDKKATSEGWKNTQTIIQDAQNLDKLSDDSFSHVLCTFVINFTEDPEKTVREMHRVLRSGGVVGIATWSKVSWVSCWQDAVRKVQGSDEYQAPLLFHHGTMDPEFMKEALKKAGFTDATAEPFECLHPEKKVNDAVEEFYNMGNPSIQLLMKSFDRDFIEETRPHFKAAYDEKYDGGKKRQFELALLSVGRKS